MNLRRLLLTLPLLVLLLPACGGGSDYVGVWELDSRAAIEAVRFESEGEPMGEMMIEMAESMFGDMEITMSIVSDGSFTMSVTGSPLEQTNSGTWVEGDAGITMTMTLDGEEQSATAKLEDGNLVVDYEDEGAPGFVMKRKS